MLGAGPARWDVRASESIEARWMWWWGGAGGGEWLGLPVLYEEVSLGGVNAGKMKGARGLTGTEGEEEMERMRDCRRGRERVEGWREEVDGPASR